ncbi:MAG: metallophosphatase family protein [Raineya sp.]|nr:metallophosphatase family protein [Raineya sp.]
MKIGVLSDIHANVYALRVVNDFLKNKNISKLFVLGDIVGYYYHPKEVIDILKKYKDAIYVRGNHENMLLESLKSKDYLEKVTKKYGKGIKTAIESLSDSDFAWIEQMPEKVEISIESAKIILCHGSPWNSDFYIYPDASKDIIEKLENYQSNYIFFGHTHYPTCIQLKKMLAINPGSVGQSRLVGGVANFGIFDTTNCSYTQIAIPYSTNNLNKDIEKNDASNTYLREILFRNRHHE